MFWRYSMVCWVESFIEAAAVLLISTAAAAEEPHAFSVHDLWAMDRLSNAKVSPDGSRIAFELRQTDLGANRGRSQIWAMPVDSTGLNRLTDHDSGASDPCWYPDGRWIYFLSSRSGSSQVWRIRAEGGPAESVTNFPLDVGSYILSPDGARLALSMEVFPDLGPDETKGKLETTAQSKASGRIFESLFVRHWDTWNDGRWSHLFVYTPASGSLVHVMKGMNADTPTKPFGGTEEYAFTPDGKGIVFTTKNAGREEAWSTNYDLFFAPIDGSCGPVYLTPDRPAWDTQPVFSPDGGTLAYLAMERPGYENDRNRIILRRWPNGPELILAETWDRSPQSLFWSPDGKTIYAIADNLGQRSLFAIDIKSNDVKSNDIKSGDVKSGDMKSSNVRTIVRDGFVRSLGFSGKKLVFGMDHLQSPTELYMSDPSGGKIKPITRINAEKLAAVKLGKPEQFTFEGAGGDTVYGYIVRPVDFDPAVKYPIAFLIHGGPQGSFGNDFHYRWNPQAYAGAGYAVVMVDFHGSTGYGQAFTDAIRGDWGGKPLEDLQKGLDFAVKKYPWMDGGRVAALGASYGGYMVNWIAGNWPDRFRCLVCHDGNLDERFAYFDTEELWFPEWEHNGRPWDNPEGYEKHNPLNYVKNWKTPMLVVHGGRDFRVVETHGLAAFNLLQRRGIPSKLLYFPDENHWVLKPANAILWHDTVIGWLDRWCK
ncbi:MAG TPA: S9 family peptidase [bacterium]